MKPIEEILKEVEEYEKLKGEATQGEWVLPEEEIKEGMNWHRLYTKEGFKGVCKPTHPTWTHHQRDVTFIAYAHNWSPETIIRELVAEIKLMASHIDYYKTDELLNVIEGQKAEMADLKKEIKRLRGE